MTITVDYYTLVFVTSPKVGRFGRARPIPTKKNFFLTSKSCSMALSFNLFLKNKTLSNRRVIHNVNLTNNLKMYLKKMFGKVDNSMK